MAFGAIASCPGMRGASTRGGALSHGRTARNFEEALGGMSAKVIWLVVGAALLNTVANFLLRYGVLQSGGFSFTPLRSGIEGLLRLGLNLPFVIGATCYILAALVWFTVISRAQLTAAYPLVVGLTFSMVTIAGLSLLGETFSWQKVIGIAVILVGIVAVATA
jgi:multidrug transporter EmrE-like cation transporter